MGSSPIISSIFMSSNGRTCGLGPQNGSSSLSVKAKNIKGDKMLITPIIIINNIPIKSIIITIVIDK